MQVLLEYKIFNSYFHNYIRSEEVKENIRSAFSKAVSEYVVSEHEKIYKYYRLEYDDNCQDNQDLETEFNKSKIIKTSSLLLAYNYFLFDNDEDQYNNCINYWLENDKNPYPIKLDYTIRKMKKYEKKLFNEKGEYVDLLDVFGNFFSQHGKGYFFKIYEIEDLIIHLG